MGQKLRNCCARFEADCRLFYTLIYCRSRGRGSSLTQRQAEGTWDASLTGFPDKGLSALPFTRQEGPRSENVFVLHKLYNSYDHPMGKHASILLEKSPEAWH